MKSRSPAPVGLFLLWVLT